MFRGEILTFRKLRQTIPEEKCNKWEEQDSNPSDYSSNSKSTYNISLQLKHVRICSHYFIQPGQQNIGLNR